MLKDGFSTAMKFLRGLKGKGFDLPFVELYADGSGAIRHSIGNKTLFYFRDLDELVDILMNQDLWLEKAVTQESEDEGDD